MALKFSRTTCLVFFGIVVTFVILLAALTTRISLRGSLDGLYLLKGGDGAIFELKDSVLLGEYERVLLKFEWGSLFFSAWKKDAQRPPIPRFRYVWNEKSGDGYIKSLFPDGTKFIVSFGRFKDSDRGEPSGLFVGGGLPYYEYQDSEVTMNETGMAFFDGVAWQHLWCNANESINSALHPEVVQYPSQWKFLGSRVLYATQHKLILQSSHKVVLDGAPFRINRHVIYRNGERHIILVINIKNIGQSPASFHYIYGDEPWVGNFGTSRGNVGWVRDRLIYYEGSVDVEKYSYVGMFDYGNRMIPRNQGQGNYTGTANFIEWLEDRQPDLAYFSNTIGAFAEEKKKIPLSSEFNRVLMLQWGPRMLNPGGSEFIILAIGMADREPQTGFPEKPTVRLNLDELSYILNAKE